MIEEVEVTINPFEKKMNKEKQLLHAAEATSWESMNLDDAMDKRAAKGREGAAKGRNVIIGQRPQ